MGRIIDKILERRKKRNNQNDIIRSHHNDADDGDENTSLPPGWFYSFEFFPPKTEAGLENLLTRIDRMTHRLDPLFIDVTWGGMANSHRSMAVATHAQRYLGAEVLLHLTVTGGATRQQLAQILDQAKAAGIRNILALRGDPETGGYWKEGETCTTGDCPRAIDLVKFIRELHGSYFGVAIAGHPEGHSASRNQEEELLHLREKIDAGADFILTQFFFDTNIFLEYVRRCRAVGITCPIIPGIMPIQSYTSFQRMTTYCKIKVPPSVWERLDPVQFDDEAVKEIGCDIASEICRTILVAAVVEGQQTCTNKDNGSSSSSSSLGILDGVHFYTLNLERSVTNILMTLGAVKLVTQPVDSGLTTSSFPFAKQSVAPSADTVRTTAGRMLPWRQSAIEKRSKNEQVRPINWANRPKSYVMRTEDWDEFPNGRWGDSTSPAFGELPSHFYGFSLGSDDDRRAMLGENLKTPNDVYQVFACYIEGKIPHIPWCETPLQPESFLIQPQLSRLNKAGLLTINSQPAVNGVPSTHKTFGWGGRGGYVYQKAYCEFFCSPENAQKVVQLTQSRPSVNLYAVNAAGDEIRRGSEVGGVTALTWGVFPNREIVQPTIFDPSAFLVWAEEAFALWTSMWLSLYDFESESYEIIEKIRDTYHLCAVIDNDYISESKQGGLSIWDAIEKAISSA